MKRIEITKKILSIILCLCMIFQCIPSTVFATQVGTPQVHDQSNDEAYLQVTEHISLDADMPDHNELFALYADQQFYGYEISTFGTAGRAKLNKVEKAMYDVLKSGIAYVAANGGSTKFVLSDVSGLTLNWTSKQLGVTYITDANVANALRDQFDMSNIVIALLDDCPFDLYWFDKTNSVSMEYSIAYSGPSQGKWTNATVMDLAFTFMVCSAYRGGNATTVKSNVSKISAVKTEAQRIVNENTSKTTYEKLLAYRDYICNAVSYNDAAALNPYTPYGDPWQLIYVFDKDHTTNVVCEGYSKAFQYLCDLSGIDCISVSGKMDGTNHMWNVVTLGGKNYLVDVTNSDSNTVGQDGSLFLIGGTYQNGQYIFTCSGERVIFTCENLNLATKNYTPDPEIGAPCDHTGGTATCMVKAICGKCGTSYGNLNPMNHTGNNTIVGKADASCGNAGYTGDAVCECGATVASGTTIPATGNHNYTTEVNGSRKAATCMATGSVTMKCGCGATEVKILPIDADNHTGNNTIVGKIESSCGNAGYTGDTICECGKKITPGVLIPAMGHSYDNQTDGTCNACGINRETVETRQVTHMFRMYNPNTGEHFYTGSEVEKNNLIDAGWQYEGVGFTFPANTGAPVHRLFQPSTGEHLYTMDEAEMAHLMEEGWNYEGIAFNSAYDTEAVQHRLHNPNAEVGAYHFTFSEEEMQNLINAGWEYQGIGWYSCWK